MFEENSMQNVILSIVVISHNQRDLLRRCLSSIFYQCMSFSYEVIVSDDKSTDGTQAMLESEFKDRVVITYCNSDECRPSMTSERAGYNRINGLRLAKGKYIIHVDGDDFYTSRDIFQLLVDTLENHPDCNLCFQNYKVLKDGNSLDSAFVGCPPALFADNPVVTPQEFIQKFPYIHNSAGCMRKTKEMLIQLLKPYTYDDVDITYQYIGQGNVALVDRTDFVYVKYNWQTASNFSLIDQRVQWSTYLTSARIVPQLALFLLKYNISDLLSLIRFAQQKPQVSLNTILYTKKTNIRLLKKFNNRYSMSDCVYLWMMEQYVRALKHCRINCCLFYRILSYLVIG